MSILKLGSTGEDVVRLQALLNEALDLKPALPGIPHFGPRTFQAVVQFQQQAGVDSVPGVVNGATWQALGQQAGAPAPGETEDIPVGPANWMIIAYRELGVHASGKGHKANPRIIEYHSTTCGAKSDSVPWCSSFINWCFRKVNIPGTDNAAAASWITWGQAVDAVYGAVTVIYNEHMKNTGESKTGNHVGFLVEADATHYTFLGGNQSHQVMVKKYAKSAWQLKAHRWPS
jgi:uncharacterized protein (TIGR02594 family)